MPERPELSPTNPQLQSLAERYGMTTDAIEDILRGTHEEYRKTTAMLTSEEIPAPPIVDPVMISSEPSSTVPPPSNVLRKGVFSGGFMVAIYIVLLIALGIAVSFRRGCFEQRAQRTQPPPIDTIQTLLNQEAAKASTPPVTPSDVSPDEVPPEALAVPRETPPNTVEKPSKSTATHQSSNTSARPTLETTSSYEAQEHLAELRAEGATKAHISQVTKNGTTKYRVYSK